MDAERLIERIRAAPDYEGQIAHAGALPCREASYGAPRGELNPSVAAALRDQGIEQLYAHQAEAIDAVRDGQSVVIVTGTASGKTLCYNIPAVEAMLADPLATMLYLYPTKALAQDQLRALSRFQSSQGIGFLAGSYDGDTPQGERGRLRSQGRVILTNPDMLHQGILPHHSRWNRFFSHLKYVVIDEVHAYRGAFGSHLANVVRRLVRVCEHYGASPQFVACSATIANPKEHAERICGRTMRLIDTDGSPRGPKHVVLWNPPLLADGRSVGPGGERRGALSEAVQLMVSLMRNDVQTIAFVRTRVAAELLLRQTRDALRATGSRHAEAIQAYRGGYLPEERREIERQLAAREVLGVASTNALELGIDIGSLDASLIVGYPGTIASLWQQAGRAGRGVEDALVIVIGQNTPIDQYLMAHSDYLLAQTPEQAVIDPDNPHIAVGHLRCACHELPLCDEETRLFGEYGDAILELLGEEGNVRHLRGRWHFSSSDYPAAHVNLRSIPGPVYTIQEDLAGERIIGTMDEPSALSQLHTHAVYIHGGETYIVRELNVDQKVALVERRDLDYYTQSIQMSQIRVEEIEDEAPWRGATVGFGDVTVTTTIPMFRKIGFDSRDSLGWEQLELPPQTLETVAFWLAPSQEVMRQLREEGIVTGEALIGLANLLVDVAPLYVMCDPSDIGAAVDSGSLGVEALFVFDRYPGGLGFAERCRQRLEEVLHTAATVLRECACEEGCPSCVGSAVPAFAATDLDSSVRGRMPDKRGALRLLELVGGAGEPQRA